VGGRRERLGTNDENTARELVELRLSDLFRRRRERDGLQSVIDPVPTSSMEWEWRGLRRTSSQLWERHILSRVQTTPDDGCWLWVGNTSDKGYPRIRVNGKTMPVSRVTCALFHGADLLLADWQACHHCDTPLCIKPGHLYVGDNSTNITDSYNRGRRAKNIPRHCKHGHEFTLENTGSRQGRVGRRCRACSALVQRRYLDRLRQEKAG
jgi:hypothetical protein